MKERKRPFLRFPSGTEGRVKATFVSWGPIWLLLPEPERPFAIDANCQEEETFAVLISLSSSEIKFHLSLRDKVNRLGFFSQSKKKYFRPSQKKLFPPSNSIHLV